MTFTLISATPSPFARMNRITMLEKGIPFELQNEIPWHKTETKTPQFNPLEKLPILLKPEDPSFEPVYDSAHIQHYLVEKYADKSPKLLTGDIDLDLKAYQIQTLSEGVLDAFVLQFFETARPEEKRSSEWYDRQDRKVKGAFKAFDDMCKNRKGDYLIGDGKTYTIADIAVVCAVDQIEFGGVYPGWKENHPSLSEWVEKMDSRDYYKDTKPIMFDIKTDRVV